MKIRSLPRLFILPVNLAVFLTLLTSHFAVNAQNTEINGTTLASAAKAEEKALQKAEQRSKDINWWVNIPNSPATFTITPNGRFGEITNYSNKNIISLDLGCLKPRGETFAADKFVKNLDSRIAGADIDGGLTSFLAGIYFFSNLAKTCVKENSALGVYKIYFNDGSTWKIDLSQPNTSSLPNAKETSLQNSELTKDPTKQVSLSPLATSEVSWSNPSYRPSLMKNTEALVTSTNGKLSSQEMPKAENVYLSTSDKKVDTGVNKSPLKFESLFVRFMNEEESKLFAADNLDPDLLVKYRILNLSNQTVYFYSNFAEIVTPAGNMVKETSSGIVWLIDSAPTLSTKSPGLRLYDTGKWIALPPNSAFEWETLEISSPTAESHAKTLFIKTSETGTAFEIFSDFYIVPASVGKISSPPSNTEATLSQRDPDIVIEGENKQENIVSNYFTNISYFTGLAKVCMKDNSLPGVYKVTFDDGTIWGIDLNYHVLRDQSSWVNLPSSPLTINEPSNRRVILLTNISSKPLAQYSLGCVTEDAGRFNINYQQNPIDLTLQSKESSENIYEKAVITFSSKLLSECNRRNAKISVVKAKFSDGSTWIAK